MRLGIIGCGAIGAAVARACAAMDGIDEVLAHDIDPDAQRLVCRDGVAAAALPDIEQCDIVVEAANKAVVTDSGPRVLEQGGRFIILTVGALSDDTLQTRLVSAATAGGGKVHVPSGAMMGLDGVRAAREAGLKSATLVTTKPNAGLDRSVDRWTLLFNGPARAAVEAFPKNVNVAAALSMAGLGLDETWVQVAADPLATRNSHKIILEGDFGRARIEVENLPSPDNPRTSHLAALSTIALIRRILAPIELGT